MCAAPGEPSEEEGGLPATKGSALFFGHNESRSFLGFGGEYSLSLLLHAVVGRSEGLGAAGASRIDLTHIVGVVGLNKHMSLTVSFWSEIAWTAKVPMDCLPFVRP